MFRNKSRDRFRLFFTTDIHGSEQCFLKFVNAGKHYQAQVLVLGGDITGKAIVPLICQTDGTIVAHFMGAEHQLSGDDEVAALEKSIRFAGFYPYQTTPDEAAALDRDAAMRDTLFYRLTEAQIRRWVALADERLAGTDIRCYISSGNDDWPEVDEWLAGGRQVINPEGRTVEIAPGYAMVSVGLSNPTPWHSPRECSEEELRARIEQALAGSPPHHSLIMNLHCPPYDSGLDTVQKIDSELRPVFQGGQPVLVPVGSTAVREAILTHRPLLALHGHCHESKAATKVGQTLCINPGSDYSSGALHGAMVDVEDGKIVGHLLTRN